MKAFQSAMETVCSQEHVKYTPRCKWHAKYVMFQLSIHIVLNLKNDAFHSSVCTCESNILIKKHRLLHKIACYRNIGNC